MSISNRLTTIASIIPLNVRLVAVSKTKPIEYILEAYSTGHRAFGENKVQEMVEKHAALPKDIEWHLIGHLQKNKVKYIASFVSLIHGVDSFSTLKEINKQAIKHKRIIPCLLQIKIAQETNKFGFSFEDASELIDSKRLKELTNVDIVGLMGMATFTENQQQLQKEFSSLKSFFDTTKFNVLSMGMSGDYSLAIQEGSTMVRVGTAIFGSRNTPIKETFLNKT